MSLLWSCRFGLARDLYKYPAPLELREPRFSQKLNFNANCTSRGLLLVEMICPNRVPPFRSLIGLAKFTVLRRLKNSVRTLRSFLGDPKAFDQREIHIVLMRPAENVPTDVTDIGTSRAQLSPCHLNWV